MPQVNQILLYYMTTKQYVQHQMKRGGKIFFREGKLKYLSKQNSSLFH